MQDAERPADRVVVGGRLALVGTPLQARMKTPDTPAVTRRRRP